MAGLRTEFEFVLPRGYVDEHGAVHRRGVMRMATARDELDPLRDSSINGPDDPRLTILVLARVVRTLGSMELVTPHEIEGLFAVDLAYLQDFYGVINFGSDADIDSMLAAQGGAEQPATESPAAPAAAVATQPGPSGEAGDVQPDRPQGRRAAIEEVPAGPR
ncbi:MAG: hypothetical protein QOD92_93 [Acidimicrobiaceae bacterium]|jgi:hypothetical protein